MNNQKWRVDMESNKTKRCNNCMILKKGDCFGKVEVCSDYKPIPIVYKKEKEKWPKYGDATMFRLGRHINHRYGNKKY